MTKGEAAAIIKDIHSDMDPERKLAAIQEVVDMETHNSVTKQDLIGCLRWLVEDYL